MASGIVGLDIGRDTIRAVEVMNATKARPTVVRYKEIALPEGAVTSGEVREIHTVSAALRRLWSTGGFKSRDVVLGIGNQRVLARDLTVPRASITQIRESLRFQVQDMLPVPVSEALLDFYPISEGIGEQGPVVNGLLIAAIKESVMANVTAVTQAGLKPVQVDLIPFALSRALIRGNVAAGTVALIDIGASITHVVVATAGVPQFVRMIPVGGEDINRALVARLELSPQQAEAVKRQRGFSMAAPSTEGERAAAEIINETVTDLLNSLKNTLNYYANQRQSNLVQALILTGGGARLDGLAYALGDAMKVPVLPGDPFATIEKARTLRSADPGELAGMTLAIGLAIGSAA